MEGTAIAKWVAIGAGVVGVALWYLQEARRGLTAKHAAKALPSDEQISRWIEQEVRSGYGTTDEIIDNLGRYLRRHPDAASWRTRLDEALAQQQQREHTWPDSAPNDRIDQAFAELETRGIIMEQDAGYTMSDGWSVVGELSEERPDAWGGAFFHRQDVESAMAGQPLLIAFGAFDEGPDHAAKSLALAHDVCDALQRNDVANTWNGTLDERIAITPFEWRKRRWPRPPS